jgi:hypothetical protein
MIGNYNDALTGIAAEAEDTGSCLKSIAATAASVAATGSAITTSETGC